MRTTVVGTPRRELRFVELTTDDGLVGVGEARMVNKTDTLPACIGELGRRYVLGAGPRRRRTHGMEDAVGRVWPGR